MRYKSHTRPILGYYNQLNLKKEDQFKMKIVTLCREGSCCPVVKIEKDYVEIGEEGNLCKLTTSEWETLKSKILNHEA